jgi:uncharacterized Zn finger protein
MSYLHVIINRGRKIPTGDIKVLGAEFHDGLVIVDGTVESQSGKNPYSVHLEFDEAARLVDARCSCPHHSAPDGTAPMLREGVRVCKHIAALALLSKTMAEKEQEMERGALGMAYNTAVRKIDPVPPEA